MRVLENGHSEFITKMVFKSNVRSKGHIKTFETPQLGSTFPFHLHFWNKTTIQFPTNNLTVGRDVDKDVNSVIYKKCLQVYQLQPFSFLKRLACLLMK